MLMPMSDVESFHLASQSSLLESGSFHRHNSLEWAGQRMLKETKRNESFCHGNQFTAGCQKA